MCVPSRTTNSRSTHPPALLGDLGVVLRRMTVGVYLCGSVSSVSPDACGGSTVLSLSLVPTWVRREGPTLTCGRTYRPGTVDRLSRGPSTRDGRYPVLGLFREARDTEPKETSWDMGGTDDHPDLTRAWVVGTVGQDQWPTRDDATVPTLGVEGGTPLLRRARPTPDPKRNRNPPLKTGRTPLAEPDPIPPSVVVLVGTLNPRGTQSVAVCGNLKLPLGHRSLVS